MRRIVFYSWQSDLPNSTNRGFIQAALEKAAAAIAGDGSVAIEPVVDRDTQGVAGSPDIAATIFAKITAADMVVADVSIISRVRKERSFPNPNVLVELGYALKALGYERVILVFNLTFGRIEELPFDLKMRRLVTYNMPEKAVERASERTELERKLEVAIRTALANADRAEEPAPAIPAVNAIENSQPNRIVVLRRNLGELLTKFEKLEPTKYSAGGTAEDLIAGINSTQEVVAEFSKIAEIIALMSDVDAAIELYRWFGRIFERYNLPPDYTGRSSNADCDYFKFIGHEIFVTFVAFLLREQKWDVIGRVLAEPIPLRYVPHKHGSSTVSWEYASDDLPTLIDENRTRKRICLHSDILHTRHTKGGLVPILPFEDFAAADLFLFLFGEIPPNETPTGFIEWRAWSSLYLKTVPMFIHNAEHKGTADVLAKLLKVPSVAELKRRLEERAGRINRLFNESHRIWPIISKEDIDRIGTR